MDRERLDGWCERAIIALVLAILCFAPLATGAVRALEFLVVQYLTVGAALLWIVRLWLKPRPQLLTPPMAWAVIAFTGYAVACYFMADIEYVARLELIRVVVYAVLFFVILNNLHRQESVNLVGYTLLFLAMGIAFYAGYQFFTGDNRVWHFEGAYKGRGTGTYINPNHLAGFLEALLPLGLAYTIAGRLKPVLRILLAYATVVIMVGLAITLSRGAWIAAGLSLVLFFWILLFHRGYRLTALFALILMIGAAAAVLPKTTIFRERMAHGFQLARGPDYLRYQLWGPALDLWREQAWVGIGPGHFDYRFRSVRPQEIQLRPDRAHNDFLNTLTDWGIIGLALVLGALGVLAVGIARAWRHIGGVAADLGHRRSNRFAFVLGASIGLVALLLHSAVDFNMHVPANALLAVAFMALLAAHLRFASERWWSNAPRWAVLCVSLLLGGTALFLAGAGGRRAAEYVWLTRADQRPNFSAARAEALKAAFAAEPNNFETAYQIGECYRTQSWEGADNYVELANEALRWFDRALKLNPYDAYSALRTGMCLDWIGRKDESGPFYNRAEELDPNGYYTVAHVGWHYVQLGNYAAARPWFERSLRLQWDNNTIATTYLELCNRRLLEAAAQDGPPGLTLPPR